MIDSWLRLPIYLNGEKRFDANPSRELTVVDAYERMCFVTENIEFCFAEGRNMDGEIYCRLEDLGDGISRNNIPSFNTIVDLQDRISERYGFGISSRSSSVWIQRDASGQHRIWIDRDTIAAESNKLLFD